MQHYYSILYILSINVIYIAVYNIIYLYATLVRLISFSLQTYNVIYIAYNFIDFCLQNFTVKVDDNGFSPRFTTINTSSRVWFIWQNTDKRHNIQQVSFQGEPVMSGFSSGAPRDSPSAFMHQFHTPGVYYFVRLDLRAFYTWHKLCWYDLN